LFLSQQEALLGRLASFGDVLSQDGGVPVDNGLSLGEGTS